MQLRAAVVTPIRAAIMLSGVAIGVVLWNREPAKGEAPQDTPAFVASSPLPPLTPEQAKALTADLTSGDETRFRQAFAFSDKQSLAPGTTEHLSRLKIKLDLRTWKAEPDNTASVLATVTEPGSRTVTWHVYLVPDDGHWEFVTSVPEE